MNYAIVTPAKNEEANIDYLFFSIKKQSIKPKVWIIVNDNSDDRTKEFVERNLHLYGEDFKHCDVILYNNEKQSEYDLKIHYSEVVKKGFDIVQEIIANNNISLDYIGILDSDLFPEPNYYEKLMEHMNENKIDICSGNVKVLTAHKLIIEKVAEDWPRGGCRLYTYKCYGSAGFEITRSPDTYSTLKAQMLGFRVGNFKEAFVLSLRETGSRHAYKYYGESDRYFGYEYLYALSKFMFKFLKNPSKALAYINGYMNMKEVCPDKDIVQYVRKNGKRKILMKLKRLN